MRTAHRKNSRSRRRSAPDTGNKILTLMDRRFSLAVLFLVACGLAFSAPAALARSNADEEQEEEASNAKPDAGGIVIDPSSGKIAEGDTITITFPVPMLAADLIDVGNQPSPFVSEPKFDGTFLWKSQTEGIFTVTSVVAEARHRLTLN